ncbi:MAG: hypothetical protein GKR88_19095 [Flavobacteriaceae bacterium]|nr:MAG: hypothetical protein GKR88_19095 [Flavobacteriaceae bacterium]
MKIKLFFLAVIAFFSISIDEAIHQNELDYISIKSVKVNNQISINSTKKELVKSFGKPDSIEKFFNELIDEKPTYRYKYGNSYFDIYDSKVSTFMVADSKFSIMGFSPGMNLKKLVEKFPKSYASKYVYDEKLPSRYNIRVGLKSNKSIIDSDLFFKVDNKKVLSIEYWEDY